MRQGHIIKLHNAHSLRHTRALYINIRTQPTSTVILFLAKSDKISRQNVLHNTSGADKFESASRRKKVNCLNFKIFFQLCISLLEMISILVNGCHPNFEPIEFKLAHVKRKLMLINWNSRSFLLS